MRVLITGSSGHLGEALMRRLPALGFAVRGLDLKPGASSTWSARSPIRR